MSFRDRSGFLAVVSSLQGVCRWWLGGDGHGLAVVLGGYLLEFGGRTVGFPNGIDLQIRFRFSRDGLSPPKWSRFSFFGLNCKIWTLLGHQV